MKLEGAGGKGLCHGNDAFGAGADDAEFGNVVHTGGGDCFGRWREVGELRERGLDSFAEGFHEATGERGGSLDGDLLTQDGTDGEVEAIECAGHAKAGVSLHCSFENRALGELGGDEVGPCGEVEQTADAAEQGGQHWHQRVGELDHQGVFFRGVPDTEPTFVMTELDSASVGFRRSPLGPRKGTEVEELEDAGPVVRRAIGELEG